MTPRRLSFLARLAALAAFFLHLAANAAPPPDLELALTLDPASREFTARAVLHPAGRTFRFVLHEALTVTAARADGTAVTPVLEASRDGLRQWRVAAAPAARLELDYRGTLPALDPAIDHRGVLRALPPMASPAGSYLEAGSGWYPAPARRFSYRVELTVPGAQRALVTGELVSESPPSVSAASYRATYLAARPAAGITLMAGPWRVRERIAAHPAGGELRLRTWFPAELDAEPGLADAWLADSQRYIEHYSARIGPYPYAGFSVVAAPLPTGFGMPGLTYLGADIVRLPFIRATSLGHEVLHNWWGNGVFIEDGGGNWSEGLTTFMADYAYKEAESADAARAMRLGWLRDFAAVPAQDRRPLASFRSRSHGAAAAVGYGKSAMLFVMLRDLVGEADFERGIQRFWTDHQFRPAGWDDLRAAFEAVSGHDLGAFFRAWLERSDAPAPGIVRARAKAGDPVRLTLELAQTAPAYPLRLPLEIRYAERTETRWIALDTARATVSLDLAAMPASVRLDPDLRVWRMLAPAQLPPILRQWVVARAPRLVLASPELDASAQALAARLFEDAPQRVTESLTEALAHMGGPLLLVGTPDAVDAALAAAGLPPRPETVGRKGSAQVWTIARSAGAPLAVVSARDAEALRALLRPLPHYGAQSWLVFDGGRAQSYGSWPADTPAVAVTVQP